MLSRMLLIPAACTLAFFMNTPWLSAAARSTPRKQQLHPVHRIFLSAEARARLTKCSFISAPSQKQLSLFCQYQYASRRGSTDKCWRQPHKHEHLTRQHSRAFRKMSSRNDIFQPTQLPKDEGPSRETHKFDGVKTKYGKRQRKANDKLTNNARVRNSYLKITLGDAILDQLHGVVCDAKRLWEDTNKLANDLSNNQGPTSTQTVSKKQSKRQLSIKPRTRNSLHMTYFFAGKVLDDMTSEELHRWESKVRQCVSDHKDNNDNGGTPRDYSLRYKSLVTFPPRKNYLVVAEYESSPDLDDLYKELCNLAIMEKEQEEGINADSAINDGGKEYEFPLLRDLTLKQQKKRKQHGDPSYSWVAHITLGTLAGGTHEDARRLSEWLGSIKRTGEAAGQSSKADLTPEDSLVTDSDKPEKAIIGLALAGPAPEHVDIDWNFPFH